MHGTVHVHYLWRGAVLWFNYQGYYRIIHVSGTVVKTYNKLICRPFQSFQMFEVLITLPIDEIVLFLLLPRV